jgi:acyl-CoA thioesterase-1
MGDDHQSGVGCLLAREQQVDNRGARHRVEVAGRFIGEDDRRARRDGAGDGDTLLLAARQLRGIMVDAVRQADGAELVPGQGEGIGMAGQLEGDGDIFERGHGRKQMEGLEHDADAATPRLGKRILAQRSIIDAANQDPAAACPLQSGQDRHQRGFARAGGAEDRQALAAADFKVDALEDLNPRLAGAKRQRDIARTNGDAIGVDRSVHDEECSLPSRLAALAVLLLFVQLCACSPKAPSNDFATNEIGAGSSSSTSDAAIPADTKLVVAFGDSLYAGYNLGPNEGFAPMLGRALEKKGIKVQVVNAGVSGETTADGLQRLSFTLDGLPRKPDLVLVGLGANDMLRGLDPAAARANLDAILTELKRRRIEAMLTGMMASRNMGPDYAAAFDHIYPELAKKFGVPLYPFFLDGVVGHRELELADGMHPNARGVVTIVERVAPVTARALKD